MLLVMNHTIVAVVFLRPQDSKVRDVFISTLSVDDHIHDLIKMINLML